MLERSQEGHGPTTEEGNLLPGCTNLTKFLSDPKCNNGSDPERRNKTLWPGTSSFKSQQEHRHSPAIIPSLGCRQHPMLLRKANILHPQLDNCRSRRGKIFLPGPT